MGDENPIHTLGDYSKPSHEGYRNTIELPDGNNVVPLRSDTIRRTIDQAVGGKLCHKNAKESWALLEDLALYENEGWNDPRDFTKSVKAISLPQDVPSTSDCRLIELENQVQRLRGAHLAPKPPIQTKREASGTLSNPSKTTLVTPIIHHGKFTQTLGLVSNFMASQDARLSKFEANFKQQQGEMTDKIDIVLKAINDRITGALLSDTVKNMKLNVNSTSLVLNLQKDKLQTVIDIGTPKPTEPEKALEDEFKDLHVNLPVLEVLAHAPILGDSNPFDTLADLGSCVNLIPLYLFKKLKIRLLEDTNHVFGLTDGTKSYHVGIVKNVEVHIGRLKLLDVFYVLDMDKDPAILLLVGRGFLATANAVIDYKKAKIAVGERVTRSVFGVKEIGLDDEEIPYWTTLGKQEFYEPRPSTDGIGAHPPFYARKDFIDYHFPWEWEIARGAELNPFKDVLVFRKMVDVGIKSLLEVTAAQVRGLGEEDASKQGRIDDIDANEDIYLVNVHRDEDMFGVNDHEGDEMIVETEVDHEVVVETKVASKDVNLSVDEVTLAQALAALKSAKPKADKVMLQEPEQGIITTTTNATIVIAASTRPRAKGLVIHEEEQATTPIVSSQQPSQVKVQDKDKGIMQEELTDAEKARLFVQFLEQRRKHFAAKRAEEKRNRPPTKAQQRSIMCTYLKNMAGYKHIQLKNKSFDDIQKLFDKVMKRVTIFVDMDTKLVEGSEVRAEGSETKAKIAHESSLKRAGEELE
ncbi:MAK10-like protein [Tanacetum coccineum]